MSELLQKRPMKVQREFSRDVAQALETVEASKLAELLGVELGEKPTSSSQPSKWAKMVEKIESMNISSDVGEHIRKCSKEFREDFAFKHDQVDEE